MFKIKRVKAGMYYFIFLFFLPVSAFDCQIQIKDGVEQNNKNEYFYLPTSTTGEIVHHQFYSLSFSREHHQSEWVSWKLDKTMMEKKFKRKNRFRPDPAVSASAENSDYKKSGFDKGHLCPAGDMTFDKSALDESFLMSNIAPQNPKFNRRIWKNLEEQVRTWVMDREILYIYAGGILSELNGTIGTNQVSVPAAFYKIILYYTAEEISVIAFIIPNSNSKDSYFRYTVPVDEIEEKTGIDFFQFLPDELEESVESRIDLEEWRTD